MLCSLALLPLAISFPLPAAACDAQSTAKPPAPDAPRVGDQTPDGPGAPGIAELDEVVVEGRSTNLVGVARSATEGSVGREELERRPILRPGDILEAVPGVIITQHSGAGKANQFFLRGFNLDHGTDLSTRINGVPNNLPSHGHGQGYNDLTPLIPELIERVDFAKGPYDAASGNFSSAGHVSIDYVRRLDTALALVEAGSFGYGRALVADSVPLAGGDLLFATEITRDDGPWTIEEDFSRLSGVLRWSEGDEVSGTSVSAVVYDADWTATDQIARRATRSGELSRFDSLDPTTGGESSRATLGAEWWGAEGARDWGIRAYTFWYDLDLYSNFTYFLSDPVNGDQFLQEDRRWVLGLEAENTWHAGAEARRTSTTVGVQLRNDSIDNALRNTAAREVLSTVRADDILETNLGVYADNETRWLDWLRSTVGVRADVFRFDVDSDLAANSGTESDSIVSPKLGLVFGPWSATEVYAQAGYGFHSNDARGVTLRDDPSTPAVGDGVPVDPLAQQRGFELGVRTAALQGLQSTVSVWHLASDSELVFIGDAGNTGPSGATERFGVEWTNFFDVNEWLALDLDAALSRARFTDGGDDDHVPGAIERTLALGATIRGEHGDYVALRGRYFGPRDLDESGTVQSSSSFLVNAHAGWRFNADWLLQVSVFNLFDREVDDIEYYYPSRLANEPPGPDEGGYNDIHFHPAVPLTLHVGLVARF